MGNIYISSIPPDDISKNVNKKKDCKTKIVLRWTKRDFWCQKMNLLTFSFFCVFCAAAPVVICVWKLQALDQHGRVCPGFVKKAEDGIKIKSDAEFQVGLISKFKILRRAQHYYYSLMIKIPQRVKLLRLYIFQTRCP